MKGYHVALYAGIISIQGLDHDIIKLELKMDEAVISDVMCQDSWYYNRNELAVLNKIVLCLESRIPSTQFGAV